MVFILYQMNVPRMLLIAVHYGKSILRKFIIGWCEGERLACRPKTGEVAVMIERDVRKFWFHLRKEEFDVISKED